jgi:hypothetical protein
VSPVARSQAHAGRALAVAAAGVILVMGVAGGVAVLASRGDVDVRLGDETFAKQDASNLAEKVASDGPVLYADAASGDRDIVVQHLGSDEESGWVAMAARPAGVPRNCSVQWQADDEEFLLLDTDGETSDDCDGRAFPADGEGLPTYPVTVADGKLDIDINAADRTSTTTDTTVAESTVPISGN